MSNELVITRVFDAPRAMVYRAFMDPDQLSQWFGPVGWSVPRDTVDIEPRVGGHQRFVMVNDADPTQTSPANGTFEEIIENELLVGSEQLPGTDQRMRLRIEFHDEGGKTRLVLRQSPYSDEIVDQARTGWESSFTKLDALLAA
jgi:uncharacterized protein YndB with AHSA1/START domain